MNKIDLAYIDMWAKKIRAINYIGGKCAKCGDNNIFHLCFHHLKDKDFELSHILSHRWSIILNEIKKCELLCNNCHHELHYSENVVDESLRKNKEIYLEYKETKCIMCGYNKCKSSLVFHHHNNDKFFNISKYRKRFNTIKDLDIIITDELNKCDVLCQNCHNEEHINIEKFNIFKEKIYYKVNNFKELQSKISRNEVKKLYENGMKQFEIAKYFNASKGTISGIFKELNL